MTITNTNKYNGWTNYETWLCNMWFDNFEFTDVLDMFEGCEDKGDINNVIADYIKNYVEDYVEYSLAPSDTHGFVHDMLNSAISEIDFRDIAEHYVDDVESELIEAAKADEECEDEGGPFFTNFADHKESLATA